MNKGNFTINSVYFIDKLEKMYGSSFQMSINEIAASMGMYPKAANDYLKRSEFVGLITIKHARRRSIPNTITINMDFLNDMRKWF